MVAHHFTDAANSINNIHDNLVFNEKIGDIIQFPAPALFDSHARNGYTILPADIVAY